MLNWLRNLLTSRIPGAGTGTSSSSFIVVSDNLSSSTFFTSLTLQENKLNAPCQHDIINFESIDVNRRHYLFNYYCIIDKLTRRIYLVQDDVIHACVISVLHTYDISNVRSLDSIMFWYFDIRVNWPIIQFEGKIII